MSIKNDQVTPAETAEILRLAAECLILPGDFVELGCYRGSTSVLLGKLLVENPVDNLCKKSPHPVDNSVDNSPKTLYIYDSFAGLPEKTPEDSSSAGQNFQPGALSVSKRVVVAKLRQHGLKISNHPHPSEPSIIIKKAWFSDLTLADLPSAIAFAFLDGDLYQSIKTSLRLVIPLLTKQGIIIIHDYHNPELPGSTRAVDEFLRAHPDFQFSLHHSLAILRKKC